MKTPTDIGDEKKKDWRDGNQVQMRTNSGAEREKYKRKVEMIYKIRTCSGMQKNECSGGGQKCTQAHLKCFKIMN
mgnify:CR=1 FL=1